MPGPAIEVRDRPRGVTAWWSDPVVRRITVIGVLGGTVSVIIGALVRPGPGPALLFPLPPRGGTGLNLWVSLASMAALGVLVWKWVELVGLVRNGLASLNAVLGAAVVWAVPFALGPALFSRDVFSYINQSEIAARGLDTYSNGPVILGPGTFQYLADPIWRKTAAPYGPVWLNLGSTVADVTGHRPFLMVTVLRLIVIAATFVAGWRLPHLARRLGVDPARVAVLAVANPLLAINFVSGAHNDALMLALVVVGFEVALMAPRSLWHRAVGVICVSLAAGVKIPIIIGVVTLGWGWPGPGAKRLARIVASGVAGAASLVVLAVASTINGLGFGWTGALDTPGRVKALLSPTMSSGLVVTHGLHGLGWNVSYADMAGAVGKIGLAISGLLWLRAQWRSTSTLDPWPVALFMGATAILGPALYAWYLLVPIPLFVLCERRRWDRIVVWGSVGLALTTLPSGGGILHEMGWAGHYVVPLALVGWFAWTRRNRSRWVRWIPTVISGLGALAYLWRQSPLRRLDFHIYSDAIASMAHGSLYDYRHPVVDYGFTYPPVAVILLTPLRWGSETFAEHAWLVVTVLAGAAFLALGVRLLPNAPSARWFGPLAVAAGLWSVPLMLTARIGQVNALISLAVMLDVLAVKRGWRYAGLGIGAATAVKLTPGLLIPFLFWAGRRREAMVAAATAAVATAIGWVAFPDDSVRFWGTELWATRRVGVPLNPRNNSIRRFASALIDQEWFATLLWLIAAGALVVLVFIRARRALRGGDPLTAVTLVMCATYVASPISWTHHLYFALIAVLLVLADLRDPRRIVAAALLAVAFFDPFSGGEGVATSVTRAVALVLVCVALPVRSTPPSGDEPPPQRRPLRPAPVGASAD